MDYYDIESDPEEPYNIIALSKKDEALYRGLLYLLMRISRYAS